jgi:hypothetical protein
MKRSSVVIFIIPHSSFPLCLCGESPCALISSPSLSLEGRDEEAVCAVALRPCARRAVAG